MAVTLESLRKSVGKKNSNSMVFAWLADLERVAGDLDKALQRVDGGLTLYPNDISARLVRAKILTQLESYQPCIDECERIIVMDPFNLAAQQLMGNAYDKLGMLAERNACYRRLHDMDPLNTFWKEEYDVVLESTVAAAAAAADSEFIMSDSTQDLGGATSPLDMSFDDETSSEPATADAGADTFEMPATADSIDSPMDEANGEESASEEAMADDPFASLAAMLPNGDASDDSTMDDLSASLESAMDSIKTDESEGLAEEFGAEENISSSDVSSALSDMFGLDDDLEPEESTSTSPFASAPQNDIPASIDENAQSNAASVFESHADDDKPQSIDDAFGDIFGEDELPEEKSVAASAAAEEISDSAETEELEPKSIESLAESPLDEGIEDKDDESSLFEKSAEEADKPQSIDDAFGSIFGEDELPEESSGNGLFEKSASADMNLTGDDTAETLELPAEETPVDEAPVDETPVDETPAEEAPAEETLGEAPAVEAAPAADEPTTIDNAFDSIFGEDELPEEKPVESVAEPAEETLVAEPAEESLDLPAEDDTFKLDDEPALDAPALESPIDNLFGDDKPAAEEASVDDAPVLESPIDNLFADDTPAETEELVAEAPAAEAVAEEETFKLDDELETPADETPVVETPADDIPVVESPAAAQPASDAAFSVDSAFDSIFGADDDLPEEKPAEAVEASETAPEETVSLEEQVNQAEAELELPETKSEETSDLAQEMGGAFASMFGNTDDDLDLPEVSAPAAADNQEAIEQELTEAPAAEAAEETFEKAPESAQEALEDDIDKSFDNLFGKDDDLPVEGSTAPAESVAQPEKMAEETPAAEPAQDLDSLESEVSGAFKGLFDMDDDSLTEETKPSNKGVDFLMSGDSDDEISAGLINDPDAPLDRGAQDLDESLNTRTLAEIYFDQGLYAKALEIYKDLAQKEPENEDIAVRLAEVEKLYNDKFGGNA